ncbi:MAG: HD domain-containing protein [Clostridiales bacterium]|jgi:metal-dependent HD superfamily phosphatase/phosphodiesterase|nr:HD domain-containing protein [Clostridiales bacterium]
MQGNIVTMDIIKNNSDIRKLILAANANLQVLGYTEHGLRHVGYVSDTTRKILLEMGYENRICELGAIAGWMHDIGNSVSRRYHGLIGANMAFELLVKLKMDMDEIAQIISAIGNHEEQYGLPINTVSAALIIADKADAHKTRVRKKQFNINNIHDRVNISITKSGIEVDKNDKKVKLIISMDHQSAPMEFLQIYLSRITLSEKAAEFLGYQFDLVINDIKLNNHQKNL